MELLSLFTKVFLKFFFLLGPFAVLGITLDAFRIGAGALLFLSAVRMVLGKRGLAILTKLTGLFLASLAAQMIFTGIRNFLSLPTPPHA